jgi:phenylpyruvate tautomerase PptA (4-oxalocrotonate tautomerase family)
MPLVSIRTNVSLERKAELALASSATAVVAQALGKPESVTMASVESGVSMTFGVTSEPTALFEVEGIELISEPAEDLCRVLSDLAEETIGVDSSRTFVKLGNVPRGYWAGNRKVY